MMRPPFVERWLAGAIRALKDELDGGKRAELPPELESFAALLLRRELQARAAQLEAPERELVAALPDAAAIVGKDGRVRVANTAFEALAPAGRALRLTPLEVTRSEELGEAVRRALEGTARRLELELSRRAYFAQITPLLRGEVLVVLRDITERKRAEVTRRDFVAHASHELRTPVSAIAGAAETLLSGALSDPEAARRFVEMVARHADRLSRLTRDLLDLSKLEAGQWPIHLEAVDLPALSRNVLELWGGAAAKKAIALEAEVPEGLAALADTRALEQVLVNLVDNAIKYTPNGGTVRLSGARDGPHVVLIVTDTGPGIAPQHLARVFERFYRVDPGRARDAGGTGLGLALVKHLVQAQRGDVGVESGSGGSRFWVRLPVP